MATPPTPRSDADEVGFASALRAGGEEDASLAVVPAHRLAATRAVLAERERELLELKGPCSTGTCRLHYAHAGPCDPVPILHQVGP